MFQNKTAIVVAALLTVIANPAHSGSVKLPLTNSLKNARLTLIERMFKTQNTRYLARKHFYLRKGNDAVGNDNVSVFPGTDNRDVLHSLQTKFDGNGKEISFYLPRSNQSTSYEFLQPLNGNADLHDGFVVNTRVSSDKGPVYYFNEYKLANAKASKTHAIHRSTAREVGDTSIDAKIDGGQKIINLQFNPHRLARLSEFIRRGKIDLEKEIVIDGRSYQFKGDVVHMDISVDGDRLTIQSSSGQEFGFALDSNGSSFDPRPLSFRTIPKGQMLIAEIKTYLPRQNIEKDSDIATGIIITGNGVN